MVRNLVLEAPQPAMRGDEDENTTSRLEHAAEFPQRANIVVKVLDYV